MATVAELVKKELGIEKAKISEEERAKGVESIGNLSMEQVIKIAKLKAEDMLAKNLKAAVKQVIGACASMAGIRIEGRPPKEVLAEIEAGKYDEKLK